MIRKFIAKLVSMREAGNWNVRTRDNLSARRHEEKGALDSIKEAKLAEERHHQEDQRRVEFSERTVPANEEIRPSDSAAEKRDY